MFYTYILKSLKDKSYYYGSTNNLNARLKIHNSGKVRYTKVHIPYQIHYSEVFGTRKEAYARESFFKSIEGYLWLKSKIPLAKIKGNHLRSLLIRVPFIVELMIVYIYFLALVFKLNRRVRLVA